VKPTATQAANANLEDFTFRRSIQRSGAKNAIFPAAIGNNSDSQHIKDSHVPRQWVKDYATAATKDSRRDSGIPERPSCACAANFHFPATATTTTPLDFNDDGQWKAFQSTGDDPASTARLE